MNRIIITGRLTKDVEIRTTPNGKSMVQITLAVQKPMKNQQGEYESIFLPCVAWGKTAELVGQSCQKGHRLLVEGWLNIRSYEDKNGTKHWVTEVIADRVEFIEKREQPKQMQDMGKDVPFDETVPF